MPRFSLDLFRAWSPSRRVVPALAGLLVVGALSAAPASGAPVTLQYSVTGQASLGGGLNIITGGLASFTFPMPGSSSTCTTYTPPPITTGPFPIPGGPPVNNCGPVAFSLQLTGTGGMVTRTGVLGDLGSLLANGSFFAQYKIPVGGTVFNSIAGYSASLGGAGASNPADGIGFVQFKFYRLQLTISYLYATPYIFSVSNGSIMVTGQEVPEPSLLPLHSTGLMLLAPYILLRWRRRYS